MIDSNFLKIEKIILSNVSRETLGELYEFRDQILLRNKRINLISKKTEKVINNRHIKDSAQIIDFIDEKEINVCTDLGSGAGLPGIVLSILMKPKNLYLRQFFMKKVITKASFLRK